MTTSTYFVPLFFLPTLLMTQEGGHAGDVIDELASQYSAHFTIEDSSGLFLAESATLPDNWKSQGIERDLSALENQLHSRWKISKYPLLENVFCIQAADIQDNPLDKSLASFQYGGVAWFLPAALSRREPSIESTGITFERWMLTAKNGLYIDYGPTLSISVGRSSIRDILTCHLPLNQYGPLLWEARVSKKDGKYVCLLEYKRSPVRAN